MQTCRKQSQVAETLMEVIPGAKNHQNMEGKLLAASSVFFVGGIYNYLSIYIYIYMKGCRPAADPGNKTEELFFKPGLARVTTRVCHNKSYS